MKRILLESVHNFPHLSLPNFSKMLMYFHMHSAFREVRRLNCGTILNAYKSRERILLLFALLFLSACSTMSGPKPDVSIVNLQFTEVTLLETSMELVLRVDNPRSEPLVLEGASYRVYLNDTDIGTGMTDETIEVPRLGSASHKVIFRLSNFSMIRKIQSLVESQRFKYRVESNFYVRDFGIRRTLAVTREGQFDVNEFGASPAVRQRP